MKLTFYIDEDGEPWALFTNGHVDLEKFKRSAVRKKRDYQEYLEDRDEGQIGHYYMRENTDDSDGDRSDDGYNWHWCNAKDPGAIPVTALCWQR